MVSDAREPASPRDYHRQAPAARDLEQVFCLESERSISNDWVVRDENRYFQLERTSDYPPRQAKVTVCEWAWCSEQDERIEIRTRASLSDELATLGLDPGPRRPPSHPHSRVKGVHRFRGHFYRG